MENFKQVITEKIGAYIQNIKITNEELYELSKFYSEILLKAKFLNHKGELGAIFQYEQIDKFIEKFDEKINEKSLNLNEQKELFKIINNLHVNTISAEEMRKLPSGIIPSEGRWEHELSHYGTFYSCNYIPEETVDLIAKKIFK